VPSNPLYAECIQRAALLLGGYRALGARVGVAPRLLKHWASGKAAAPETVFLKVVDVLLDESLRVTPPPRDPQNTPAARGRS